MAVIQSKHVPVIKRGNSYTYDSATFLKDYPRPHYHTCTTAEEILEKCKYFEITEFPGRKFITFDTETHPYYQNSHDVPTGVVRRWVGTGKQAIPQDYPFCISICDGTDCYTLFSSVEQGFEELRKLAPLLEDETIEKVAHNVKYDMHMCQNAGVKIKGRLHDTVVLCKLTEENRPSFALRDVVKKTEGDVVFEYMVDKYKQMHKVTLYTKIPRQLLSHYANADVWNCMCAFKSNMPKLIRDNLVSLYDNECELTVALYEMERIGMKLDKDYEVPLKEELQKIVDASEQAIYEEAGMVFNTNSGKQLYNVLMKLGVKPSLIQFTEKGNPIMDKDALAKLAEVHHVSIVEKVLTFRKNSKLLGTYAVGIYDQHDADCSVHGSINQTEATTGRMSITKPALQTLPKKDKRIRSAFIPHEGYSLCFMDLDQINKSVGLTEAVV